MSDEELCEAAHQFTPIDQRHTPDTCPACLLHARVKELEGEVQAHKAAIRSAIDIGEQDCEQAEARVKKLEEALWCIGYVTDPRGAGRFGVAGMIYNEVKKALPEYTTERAIERGRNEAGDG
jgi:hypothetical protein